MTSVLIASDHKLYRSTFAKMLLAHRQFQLLAVCADTFAASTIAATQRPDIIVVDGSNDPLAALALTRSVLSQPGTAVVTISADTDADFARHMLAAGALGYLTKKSSAAECIAALQEVVKDNVYVCEALRNEEEQASIETPSHAGLRHLAGQGRASLRQQLREKMDAISNNHWHGILRFTN
ncbi:MAG TPA: response regulator transcription factor [Chitinophagaceae bacterium]|nr:response regulator transcription factor [Chitinophagaceae bacterium]